MVVTKRIKIYLERLLAQKGKKEKMHCTRNKLTAFHRFKIMTYLTFTASFCKVLNKIFQSIFVLVIK